MSSRTLQELLNKTAAFPNSPIIREVEELAKELDRQLGYILKRPNLFVEWVMQGGYPCDYISTIAGMISPVDVMWAEREALLIDLKEKDLGTATVTGLTHSSYTPLTEEQISVMGDNILVALSQYYNDNKVEFSHLTDADKNDTQPLAVEIPLEMEITNQDTLVTDFKKCSESLTKAPTKLETAINDLTEIVKERVLLIEELTKENNNLHMLLTINFKVDQANLKEEIDKSIDKI